VAWLPEMGHILFKSYQADYMRYQLKCSLRAR